MFIFNIIIVTIVITSCHNQCPYHYHSRRHAYYQAGRPPRCSCLLICEIEISQVFIIKYRHKIWLYSVKCVVPYSELVLFEWFSIIYFPKQSSLSKLSCHLFRKCWKVIIQKVFSIQHCLTRYATAKYHRVLFSWTDALNCFGGKDKQNPPCFHIFAVESPTPKWG